MSTITVTGNLAADPELRFTPNGHPVARFVVLENRRRRTEDGAGWEDAEPNRFRAEVWGSAAENLAESCTTGDRVMVEAEIVTDRWTDKEGGQDRTAQHLRAREVAFSLRFHTVKAQKTIRTNGTDQAAAEQG